MEINKENTKTAVIYGLMVVILFIGVIEITRALERRKSLNELRQSVISDPNKSSLYIQQTVQALALNRSMFGFMVSGAHDIQTCNFLDKHMHQTVVALADGGSKSDLIEKLSDLVKAYDRSACGE